MNLSNLSLAELNNLQEELKQEIKKRQSQDFAKAKEQILAIAQSVGIPLKELMGTNLRVKSAPVAVRFRHPDNASLQWAGRGRQPGWVKEWQAAGKSLDLLRV